MRREHEHAASSDLTYRLAGRINHHVDPAGQVARGRIWAPQAENGMDGSIEKKRSHPLTREALQNGFVHDMITRSGTDLPVLSDDERRASLNATLAAQPALGDVWLFGYGSLIWNPAFHYVERKPVLIRGWHRQFCLSTPIGRGTPDRPGLVLGLDRGGSCRGVAFRVARAEAKAELELVWRREMVTGAYVPRWVKLHGPDLPHGTSGIAFTINRKAPNYVQPVSEADTARVIATACGALGPCRDYLFDTIQGLDGFGIRDHHLDRIAHLVRKHQRLQRDQSAHA
jgi:glutathione-specific gamma-glutamylcyclotransferase